MADAIRAALQRLIEVTPEPPASQCSCHVAPPCGDCVEYSGLREALDEARDALAAPPAAVAGLHPRTADLVQRFAAALAEKLAAAEAKYGWSTHWESPNWMDQCREQLVEHVAKGDPRDVAAYAAFLWHHGESTALKAPPAAVLDGWVAVPRRLTAENGAKAEFMGEKFDGEAVSWSAVKAVHKAIVTWAERGVSHA